MSAYEKQIMEAIKEKASAIRVTQRQIASELQVSIPTVKRWWGGKGVSISVLHRLCALLGVSLSQLLLEVEGGASTYTYTLEQEKALVAHPKALALFDLLVSGETVSAVQRRYALSESSLSLLLVKLDRIGLIELRANNKIKLTHGGEPQWIIGGPLSSAYRKKMINSLLGQHAKADTSFFIHSYLPEDLVLLRGKLKELENLMLSCNARGIHRTDTAESYGVYFCFKQFEWSLRSELRSGGPGQ